VITDHDLHAEGAAQLCNDTVVRTIQHPQYHTTKTRDVPATYLEAGGRFVYVGGNGRFTARQLSRHGSRIVEETAGRSVRRQSREPNGDRRTLGDRSGTTMLV
jgi:hypothetical protein